jgi:hypothetical protein
VFGTVAAGFARLKPGECSARLAAPQEPVSPWFPFLSAGSSKRGLDSKPDPLFRSRVRHESEQAIRITVRAVGQIDKCTTRFVRMYNSQDQINYRSP